MAPDPAKGPSATSSQVGIVRCNVVLPNGKSVRVPISEDAVLAELHEAAILRGSATALEFPYTVDSTALKLGGKDAAYLWDKDKISDVVEDAETHTFHLTALTAAASTSDSHETSQMDGALRPLADVMSISSDDSSIINTKIRWVLPETAIGGGRTINSLPTERDPLPLTTTIEELHDMATQKLSTLRSMNEPSDVSPTMYTRYCSLSHAQSKHTTIAYLGLITSATTPLTIFLVPTRAAATDVKEALGFKISERALATFMTSLRLFITKIAPTTAKFENFLEVLWELTHFPPAVISLREIVLNRDIQPQPCAVFAACFREICLLTAPSRLYGSDIDVLMTSRHVFSWLCSLWSHSSAIFQSSQAIVHAVEVRKTTAHSMLNVVAMATLDETVHIPVLSQNVEPTDPQASDNTQQLVVCKERADDVSGEMLALALDEGKQSIIRCYFELPDIFGTNFGLHKRRKLMDPNDFSELLDAIHQDEIFRMIGPFQLSQCASVSLPVVTLDAAGYLSLHDRRDVACGGEKYAFTWNIIKDEQKLPAAESGQHLFQKLTLLMVQRKKANTWQIDAWEDAKPGTFGGPPHEAIVVCVDTSASMSESMPEAWFENYAAAKGGTNELSRINEVKEFFKNFMVRLNAYRVSTDVALVTFAQRDHVKVPQALTRVVFDLQHALDRVETGWRTALWDGIQKSGQMLIDHKSKHPDVKLRIVALTDGINNDSRAVPADVCAELCKHDIVLDAIVIDTNETRDLFKIAKHTGGYAFHPQDRTALFQIFLLENFIDIRTRPDIVKVAIDDYDTSTPKFADLKTMFDLPPCRPHKNQNDHFIALSDAALFLRRGSRSVSAGGSRGIKSVSASSESSKSVASGATRILLDQVQNAISNKHDFIDIYVSEHNMGFWKVVMQGRPGTPYANGTFLAYLEFGAEFPRKPPTMRFITPILHPNVSKHGRICHHIFDRSWDPDFSIMQVIQHVWDLLVVTESADAIDPISALRFYTDQESAERLVKAYITRFALKTREKHRLEICGPESPVPTIRPSRANSVVSPSNTSSGSWQSVRSARKQPPLRSQLTASNLRNLHQEHSTLRDPPTFCNPSHLGRSKTMRPPGFDSSTSGSIISSNPLTIRNTEISPPSEDFQVIGGNGNDNDGGVNDSSTSNPVVHQGQHSISAVATPPRNSPTASSATLPVSRRASFFENFKNSGGRS